MSLTGCRISQQVKQECGAGGGGWRGHTVLQGYCGTHPKTQRSLAIDLKVRCIIDAREIGYRGESSRHPTFKMCKRGHCPALSVNNSLFYLTQQYLTNTMFNISCGCHMDMGKTGCYRLITINFTLFELNFILLKRQH